MNKKLVMALGAFALTGWLATGSAPAAWDDSGAGGDGGAPSSMAEMMGALGLDDAQWAKFNDLRRNYRKATIVLQAQIDIAEVELETLADTNELDMKAVATKIQQIAVLNAKLRTFRYQTLKDMRGFISADQFDTFRWMSMKMGFNFSGGNDDHSGHGHHGH